MSQKILIAYFSASGVTARAAKEMAQAVEAELYEIQREIKKQEWVSKVSLAT